MILYTYICTYSYINGINYITYKICYNHVFNWYTLTKSQECKERGSSGVAQNIITDVALCYLVQILYPQG